MLLRGAAQTLEWCPPRINASVHVGSSTCSHERDEPEGQHGESPGGCSLWRDAETGAGRLEGITLPLPLPVPFTHHWNF